MPLRSARGLAVALSSLLVLLDAGAGAQVAPLPPDFELPKADGSPGTVTFSHGRHFAAVDKCSTCHMRDFKMRRGASGPITLDAKLDGKFCGACHDGKTRVRGAVVFSIDECDRCHRP